MKKRRAFSFLDISIVVVLTAVIMYVLGGILVYRHLGGVNYSLLAQDKNLQEFISAYNGLIDNYYENLDKTTLIEGAIDGMYKTVDDPYTNYMDEINTTSLNDSLSGTYKGIGIRLSSDDEGKPVIYEVFENSPANDAGLMKGDIIIEVDGEDTSELFPSDIAALIKNTDKNETNITVMRGDEKKSFTVGIASLDVPVVKTEILEKDGTRVGYISLSVFNDTADTQFIEGLEKLESKNISSLIIDLRSNTGGYLEVAKNIAEAFIEKDKIIYSLENKDSKTDYKDKTNDKKDYKVAIVLNKGSASASEILASALKYSYNAVLVGETSFGKGKVQERSNLSTGNTVKYTTAKWLTPKGDCIDGIGLTPDYPIALDKEKLVYDDIRTDSQIMYAFEILSK